MQGNPIIKQAKKHILPCNAAHGRNVNRADELNDLRKAGRNITVEDLKNSIKRQGADELLGIADDLFTIFGRASR